MNEFFKWEYVITLFPKVLSALPTTLLIVLFATLIGSFLGLIIAYCRIERIPVLNQFSAVYVSFIRGTPILVQMFIVFYGLPSLLGAIGIDISMWDKLYFIYITYGLSTAAYFSEIFRSALSSVPNSQYEAAASIGLTKWQTYRRTLIPQAGKIAFPNLGVSIVNLLQNTSLAFSLGVLDIMGKVQTLGALYYRVLEGYFIAAVIFIVLSISLEKVFDILERRINAPKRIKQNNVQPLQLDRAEAALTVQKNIK
ncbi:amino acid ABC transporter permease [Terribacillus saccharophilus]|uniref:Amino acid ABC transporter permease n=1 Tax=Terribacillus saccharophilus TaxID=361277 RepID=A0A268A9F7_9BACI|nr:amino acid ABC transporter permease [Terribacillus saccharophilus]PAD20752.1 amino acid ABC transporter permease [Terribacillus saccharophilus]PAF21376.1 amino acid ABC transporter permease [Terribacillus saccharophilus]PAF39313.1 amino acid ABC transporter permease [Terribacillus saccharophilus]